MAQKKQISKTSFFVESFDNQKLSVEAYTKRKTFKKTLVFVHGIGGDSNVFIPLIEILLTNHPQLRCISYDLRGHGFSSRIFPSNQTIELTGAMDLRAVLSALKVEYPILLGHSFGGVILQEYLLNDYHPQPKRYVFLATTTKLLSFSISRKLWLKILQKVSPLTSKKIKRNLNKHLFFKGTTDLHPQRIISDAKHMGYVPFVLIYLSIFGWSNPDPKKLDTEKSVFIYGKKDLIFPARFHEKLMQQLKHTISYKIDTNHNAVINNPLEIAVVIEKIL